MISTTNPTKAISLTTDRLRQQGREPGDKAVSQQPGWRARGVGVCGGVDGVEGIESDHDRDKDGKLDPGVGGDGAKEEGVEDDGDGGQPGHQRHGKAAGRVLLPAEDVHGQGRYEPAPAQQTSDTRHQPQRQQLCKGSHIRIKDMNKDSVVLV